jgi:hypothetical protein
MRALPRGLRRIASNRLEYLPEERRPSKYELSPFDQSIRYSHMRKDRPDVLLTITISHRNHPMECIDECEVRCLNEIKPQLRDIGAEQRAWNPRNPGARFTGNQ